MVLENGEKCWKNSMFQEFITFLDLLQAQTVYEPIIWKQE